MNCIIVYLPTICHTMILLELCLILTLLVYKHQCRIVTPHKDCKNNICYFDFVVDYKFTMMWYNYTNIRQPEFNPIVMKNGILQRRITARDCMEQFIPLTKEGTFILYSSLQFYAKLVIRFKWYAKRFSWNAIRLLCYAMRNWNKRANDIIWYVMICNAMVWVELNIFYWVMMPKELDTSSKILESPSMLWHAMLCYEIWTEKCLHI